ncbi:RNase P subunit p30-domain-containing protein [Multifurca ochricompacta]|uniref:RNase P subunit p30-domain-containing protein n=1 Tax=Multifurca ochricompacta TaxID=376703 RepID=A0AAD4M341_9AGAM|nr:RNase P subunit p30-domain-containing protein [Multifurca ochricompacta]
MYFDLNVPIPPPSASSSSGLIQAHSSKGKRKQIQPSHSVLFTPAQLAVIETRIDLLVHGVSSLAIISGTSLISQPVGYSVLAFNQTVKTKVESKTFVNTLDPLLRQVKKRPGIIYLKRLTIILDEDSEKGSGLTNAQSNLFNPYNIIALAPTTEATFSLACLTHTQPSPLSVHIISVPLDTPRLPFRLKHTMVRTALRNGAAFEISYASALDNNAKRNWWATAREVTRVTKGKGIVVTSGGMDATDLRAPRDVGNLMTFLGLAQNTAHDATTTTPKALVLRAQTRRTYRAVLSEPEVIIPGTLALGPAELSDNVKGKKTLIEWQREATSVVEVHSTPDERILLDGRQPKRSRDSDEPIDSARKLETRLPSTSYGRRRVSMAAVQAIPKERNHLPCRSRGKDPRGI